MIMPILAFAVGVFAVQSLPALPGVRVLVPLTILIVFFLLLWSRLVSSANGFARHAAILALALACGFAWAAWRAEWRLADVLPMTSEAIDIPIVGVVDGLPQVLDGGAVRFVLRVEESAVPVPRRVQLSWYAWRSRDAPGEMVPVLRPGERWQLTVRLKRPHGFVNPGGFDYEAWLLERNIRATGYVRADSGNRRLEAFVPGFMNVVHRQRDHVRRGFAASLGGAEYAGILIALSVGDQRAITPSQWETFRRTAVGHLVAISGLHVSLVALAAGGLASVLWRRSPALMLRLPARRVAACAGLLAAAGYALLAGLGLPAQRALVMLAVAAIAIMLGREASPSRVLAIALACVLVFDPWAVLSAGFWMSFAAVGVIMLVLSGRMASLSGLRAAVRIQLAITFALTPVLLALFNAFSLVGPVANAFAIPLVSFVIAPLVLLAVVLPTSLLLKLAHLVTSWMMSGLDWLAALPAALWQAPALPESLIAVAMVAVVWLLLPRGTPGRCAACLALLPILMWSPPRPAPGEFRATVLDIGQGLAVHVQTATHDLLYDAGPPYGPATDAGERVVAPYLRAMGLSRLDTVVLSHGDGDHIGGAASVFEALPVKRLLAGLPADHRLMSELSVAGEPCSADAGWSWDGVSFELLHPVAGSTFVSARNEASCVLRIVTAGGALLLPGDIGAVSERALVGRYPDKLTNAVVVAPHHGSRSSSSPVFVAATEARHVIHSVGNLNRYRHPHPDVWSRWDRSGARNWRTDGQGAIVVEMRRSGVEVSSQRARAKRYWHGR